MSVPYLACFVMTTVVQNKSTDYIYAYLFTLLIRINALGCRSDVVEQDTETMNIKTDVLKQSVQYKTVKSVTSHLNHINN